MREIKFRAWDKETNEIVSWTEFLDKYDRTSVKTLFTSEHLIPMQYTGLKDKNGKEIYERDIVLHNRETGSMYGASEPTDIQETVEYKGGAFYPVCTQPSENFEVIGNIYENKDLLK